jgi:hypothetical protein
MELSYSPPEQQDGLQDLVGRTRDEEKDGGSVRSDNM